MLYLTPLMSPGPFQVFVELFQPAIKMSSLTDCTLLNKVNYIPLKCSKRGFSVFYIYIYIYGERNDQLSLLIA